MDKINVIIEMSHTQVLEKAAFAAMTNSNVTLENKYSPIESDIFNLDESFASAAIPALSENKDYTNYKSNIYDSSANVSSDTVPSHCNYIIRGTVENDSDLLSLEKELATNRNVKGIFSDVSIQPQLVCSSTPFVGDHLEVEKLLHTFNLWEKGMDGRGVFVAIVDTAINIDYLNTKGKNPNINRTLSWSPNPSVKPFEASVGHGTMCAFDACIAAPKCTLIDIPLLTSTTPGGSIMEGLLSDAIKAYSHLIFNVMRRHIRPGENRSLVVNNSWGMFHESWDFPVRHPGNYSTNHNHPFNKIVLALEKEGADILFAAGNCGPECPDGRCRGITNNGIYGANSSPGVLSVAGVATDLDRVGYSNKGPGRLEKKKPDITGYTHFLGSEVYSADGGTSAACPVVAGVVAAIRTKKPLDQSNSQTSPSAIRSLITSTAKDLGETGYDLLYGYGVVDGYNIINKLYPDESKRYIDLLLRYICERYPFLCKKLSMIPDNSKLSAKLNQKDLNNDHEDKLLEVLQFIEEIAEEIKKESSSKAK